MPLGAEAKTMAQQVASELRLSGYRTDICFEDVKRGNMFKRAERKGARFAVIIGVTMNNDLISLSIRREHHFFQVQ